MGGSGANYARNKKGLTEEDLERVINKGDGDGYIFDVEYQKLMKEQDKLRDEYEKAREEYLRISEELRREMELGTASRAEQERFMALLSDKGVALQQEQKQMENEINALNDQRTAVDKELEALRKNAFSGATRAGDNPSANSAEKYKGFKTDNWGESKVVEMSPVEYLRRMAFQFGAGNMESLLRTASPRIVEKIARQMRRGISFNAPNLDYRLNKAGGNVQALAALLNGYKRIPVLIIE